MEMKICNKCQETKPLEEFRLSRNACKSCERAAGRALYRANPEYEAARRKKYFENNPTYARDYYRRNAEKCRNRTRQWRAANPEKAQQQAAQYRENNREAVHKALQKYRKAHAERRKARTRELYQHNKAKCLEVARRWRIANPLSIRHTARTRKARKLQAVLEMFISEVRKIYLSAPKHMQIDHIIPLKHKDVSGLHVPWNLQYLTPHENGSKHNSFDGTYENESWRKRILNAG